MIKFSYPDNNLSPQEKRYAMENIMDGVPSFSDYAENDYAQDAEQRWSWSLVRAARFVGSALIGDAERATAAAVVTATRATLETAKQTSGRLAALGHAAWSAVRSTYEDAVLAMDSAIVAVGSHISERYSYQPAHAAQAPAMPRHTGPVPA